MSVHDVIIVGAGPAGSTLAYRLARSGLDVMLLEREHMPRVKPCGGGIDGFFMQNLPAGLDLDGIIEGEANTAVVWYEGKPQAEFPIPRPIYLTQRKLLDQRLATSAAEQGAHFVEGAKVESLERHKGQWRVSSTAGEYEAPLVVGADGAYSTVARKVGIPNDKKYRTTYIASEWDAHVEPSQQEAWQGKVMIDCSVIPLGYGWIFPKRDHLNLGFGVPFKKGKDLKAITQHFVAKRSGLNVIDHKAPAHWIPFAKVGAPVVREGVLLVGDAAGMADPATGAGISWAAKSSALAAPAIQDAVMGDPSALPRYQQRIHNMQKDMEAGMALRNLIVLRFAVQSKLWREPFKVTLRCMSGLTDYSQWAKEHPWQFRLGRVVQKLLVERLI